MHDKIIFPSVGVFFLLIWFGLAIIAWLCWLKISKFRRLMKASVNRNFWIVALDWYFMGTRKQTNQRNYFSLLLPHSQKRQKQKPNWSHFFYTQIRSLNLFYCISTGPLLAYTQKRPTLSKKRDIILPYFLPTFFCLIWLKIVRNFKTYILVWATMGNVEENKK